MTGSRSHHEDAGERGDKYRRKVLEKVRGEGIGESQGGSGIMGRHSYTAGRGETKGTGELPKLLSDYVHFFFYPSTGKALSRTSAKDAEHKVRRLKRSVDYMK